MKRKVSSWKDQEHYFVDGLNDNQIAHLTSRTRNAVSVKRAELKQNNVIPKDCRSKCLSRIEFNKWKRSLNKVVANDDVRSPQQKAWDTRRNKVIGKTKVIPLSLAIEKVAAAVKTPQNARKDLHFIINGVNVKIDKGVKNILVRPDMISIEL